MAGRTLIAAAAALTLGAQTPGLDGLPPGEVLGLAFRTVPADLTALAKAPFEHGRESGLVAGGLLLLVAADKPLTQGWQRQVETRVDYHAGGLWRGGAVVAGTDTWLVASLPAWYFGSLAAGSSRGQAAALLGGKAAVYSFLVSHVALKTLFARDRPLPDLASGTPVAGFTDSPWRWGRFHRPYLSSEPAGTAFPSFHFTLYFAVASVFSEVYGSPWLAYGLAAAGLGADLKGHRHWVSDMTAGTLLGLGIGHTVVREFRGAAVARAGKVALAVQPWTDLQGQSGLALRVVW